MHVLNGAGNVQGMRRRPDAPRRGSFPATRARARAPTSPTTAASATPRRPGYARRPPGRPWRLFVYFVRPHFPLAAPPEWFRLYPLDTAPLPRLRGPGDFPDHPVLKALRSVPDCDDHFRDEDHVRIAVAAYYGMVGFLDDNVGRIVSAPDGAGLGGSALALSSADHGDNLGTRTFWGESTMYAESAGVPLLMRGPGVAPGRRVRAPVPLVDACPTILQAMGEPADQDRPGVLPPEIAEGRDADRTVLAERHAVASITGVFMARFGRCEHVRYEGHRPQLFDRDADPGETRDLALEPGSAAILAQGERRLRAICDPAEVNARAFADQARRITELGREEAVRKAGDYPCTPAPGEAGRISS